jgi:hypothetical protein
MYIFVIVPFVNKACIYTVLPEKKSHETISLRECFDDFSLAIA